MDNKLFICSATKGKREDTLLWQTKDKELDVYFKEGNKDSLQKGAKAYRDSLKDSLKKK